MFVLPLPLPLPRAVLVSVSISVSVLIYRMHNAEPVISSICMRSRGPRCVFSYFLQCLKIANLTNFCLDSNSASVAISFSISKGGLFLSIGTF